MRGNTFGHILTLTTFGESHGPALGAVIDGCPAGIPLSEADFHAALSRRRPGQSSITTSRSEPDAPEILSGVFEGATLGTPIAVIVRNTDARSADHAPGDMRPGHADAVWMAKYGRRDWRGGGRSSGRETLSRVIGGVVAERILPSTMSIVAFVRRIGCIDAGMVPDPLTRIAVDAHPTRCPDLAAAAAMMAELEACRLGGDSLGGVVELWIDNAPPGLGEPVFHKAKALLAGALMSIGGVTGVTLGDSEAEAALPGSAFHDAVARTQQGHPLRAHGIQGGITTGSRITMRVHVKPVASIGEWARRGRHDPCIAPRIVPVVEAMAALVLADCHLTSAVDRA